MDKDEQRIEVHSWFDAISTVVVSLRQREQVTEYGLRELDNVIDQARDGVIDVLDGRPSL